MTLLVEHLNLLLRPGDVIRLGRFDNKQWLLGHGWFTFDGNRAICGWHLIDIDEQNNVRPLQLTDLDDIILVEGGCEL